MLPAFGKRGCPKDRSWYSPSQMAGFGPIRGGRLYPIADSPTREVCTLWRKRHDDRCAVFLGVRKGLRCRMREHGGVP